MYGEDTLRQVAEQSRGDGRARWAPTRPIPVPVVWRPVLTDSAAIRRVLLEANADDDCVGVIAWMHTFSPAKMWIAGLDALRKPLLHLHTQANRALPWSTIDMDFMNLNQAAHGDREFGYVQSRLGVARKTVVGHVSDPSVTARVGDWARACLAATALRSMRLARFGDNMRDVAVTEGDKVEAELTFGVSVNGYGVNALAEAVEPAPDDAVDALVTEYTDLYEVAPELRPGGDRHESLRYGARIEAGLRQFLDRRRLHRVHHQLRGPRRAAAAAGHGRPAPDGRRLRLRRRGRLEDRGTAAGSEGGGRGAARRHVLHGGLHLPPGRRPGPVLGAHMLEVCPSIAGERPKLEIHPLWHRRPGGPGAAGLRRRARAGLGRRPGRPRRPLPLGGQRDRHRRPARAAAAAARGARRLGAPAGPRAPPPRPGSSPARPHHTVLSSALSTEVLRDLAEIAGGRAVGHRRGHAGATVRPGAALEPGLLPLGEGILIGRGFGWGAGS